MAAVDSETSKEHLPARTPGRVSRRSFLRTCATAGAAAASAPLLAGLSAEAMSRGKQPRPSVHVAVVGAGAFGGWTALYLQRGGARVTLLDAWGPGNSRASSGGETRVIRAVYGPDQVAVRLVARAFQLWRENAARWGQTLFHRTGVLWMAGENDAYERAALPLLRDAGFDYEELSVGEAARRYPQVDFAGIAWVLLEKDAGVLTARRACQVVVENFVKEGGEYRQLGVEPGRIAGSGLRELRLSDGSALAADRYVFACGPWLGRLFPDVLGDLIASTRQEVFFFGTPQGDPRFTTERLPVWIDSRNWTFYGIPANHGRGFKIADDTRGEPIDPTTGNREPTPAKIQAARDYVAYRFPALKDAPLLEARVCQYEQTPDDYFIIDRHPAAANLWLVGGGSGHGFKHGPAVGELVAGLVLGDKAAEPHFSLARFAESPAE